MKWLILFGVIFLAACSSAQAPKQEPVEYTLEMTEFAFSPAELEVKVGQEVTLKLVNAGQIEHELMIGKDVKITNNRPDGYEHSMLTDQQAVVVGGEMSESGDMGGHGDSHTGFMVILPKNGDQATITFTPTEDMAGEWEIGCFSQEGVHYDAGMKGRLIVSQ